MRNCILKPRLRDTTCCQTGLTTGCIVYTAGCQTGCTTRFDKRLNEQWLFVQHGCQTGLYSRFDNRVEQTVCSFNTVVKPCLSNRLYNPVWQPVERTVLFIQHGCQTGCQTGLYNRFDNRVERTVCSFNTVVKLVVKPVWQPVWQPGLFTRYSRLSNRLYNRFDNRLYRVNGVLLQRRRSPEANQTLHGVWPSPGLVHYIYIFGSSCPLTEFCQLQYSLCVQVLRSPIDSVTARHSSSGRQPNFAVWYKNGIRELSQRAPHIFGWAAITLGIGQHSSCCLNGMLLH